MTMVQLTQNGMAAMRHGNNVCTVNLQHSACLGSPCILSAASTGLFFSSLPQVYQISDSHLFKSWLCVQMSSWMQPIRISRMSRLLEGEWGCGATWWSLSGMVTKSSCVPFQSKSIQAPLYYSSWRASDMTRPIKGNPTCYIFTLRFGMNV